MSVLSYLRLSVPEGQAAKFPQDMATLLALAKEQPGFIWAEVLHPTDDPEVYVVLSEWETLELLKAWEHHPHHDEVIKTYPGKPPHRRFPS